MYKTTDMIEDLPKVWRILAGLIPIQILGSIVGLAIGYHHSGFDNLWMGGAVATPIGFIIGLIWHVRAHEEPKPYRTVIFMGFLALLLGVAVIFYEIPRSIQEMKYLETFQNMKSKNINQIVVYDEYGDKLVKKISDPTVLNEFKSACTFTNGNTPNHPLYTASWYVQILAGETIEIECHYQEGRPSLLIGYFVKKVGSSTSFYGSFYNAKLRGWFEKYVENR
jgi:hypothetical protein